MLSKYFYRKRFVVDEKRQWRRNVYSKTIFIHDQLTFVSCSLIRFTHRSIIAWINLSVGMTYWQHHIRLCDQCVWISLLFKITCHVLMYNRKIIVFVLNQKGNITIYSILLITVLDQSWFTSYYFEFVDVRFSAKRER